MEGAAAEVVVVGADGSETSFTFDALVHSEDGDFMSTRVQYVNNDILTDCVLTKDWQELQISCGNMSWVLSSATQRLFAGSKFWAEPQDGTDASAAVEIEQYEGDGAEDTDIAVSTLVIDTSPDAEFMEEAMAPACGNSLGKISYKFQGEMCVAHCLPYGRVQTESGQVFERVDSWLMSLKRAQLSEQQ